MKSKLLKNSLYLISAQVLVKVVSFFYTLFLAKNLGVEEFGLYSAALAYFALFGSFSDFGINRYLIREIAIDNKKSSQLLSNVLALRFFSLTVLFVFFAIALYLLDPLRTRAYLTLLATFAVIPQAVGLSFDSIFVALQKVQFSAFGLIILSLFTALFGVLLVIFGLGSEGAIVGLILGHVIYALFLMFILFRYKVNFLFPISLSLLKKILAGALPYGLLAILGFLYFKIDILFLSYIKGPFETGIYSVAFRFLEAIIFIPSILGTILFPVLAKLHHSNIFELKQVYYNSLKFMGLISAIILGGYILVLPIVIKELLPQFNQSVNVLYVLSLTIPFMFLHAPGAQVILSTEKFIKPVILLSFVTLFFNIFLNLLFIPEFGYMAAAWITVLSEGLSFIIFYTFLQIKVFRYDSTL